MPVVVCISAIKIPGPVFFSISSLKTISVVREAVAAEQLTQENQTHILLRLGFGAAGALLLGPIGALAGMLGSGKSTEVCISCELRGGRKFIGACGLASWQVLHAKLAFASHESPVR